MDLEQDQDLGVAVVVSHHEMGIIRTKVHQLSGEVLGALEAAVVVRVQDLEVYLVLVLRCLPVVILDCLLLDLHCHH